MKHIVNEGVFTRRVRSTVPGFRDVLKYTVYDHGLDEHGHVTEAIIIYTYK